MLLFSKPSDFNWGEPSYYNDAGALWWAAARDPLQKGAANTLAVELNDATSFRKVVAAFAAETRARYAAKKCWPGWGKRVKPLTRGL